jgi:FlhB-like protein
MNKKTRERLRAFATRFDAERDAAPRITAKGAGLMAQRIIDCAKEHGVPIHEDPDMVAVLAKLDVGTEIPESLYGAMAEVLAFVYRLNGKIGAKTGRE